MGEQIFLNALGVIVVIGLILVVVMFIKIGLLGIQYDRECAKLNHMHELTEKDIEESKQKIK